MAGLGRKVFASGDILLASEVQGFLQDQAVMVFDDDAARGSAIATPTEGMVTFRKDDNVLEVFDGSVFAPVGSPPGLVHIKRETGSAVSAINVNNVFSSSFNNYLIITNYTANANVNLEFRLRSGGVNDAGNNYSGVCFRIKSDGTTGVVGAHNNDTSAFINSVSAANNLCKAVIEIDGPNLAVQTKALSRSMHTVATDANSQYNFGGFMNETVTTFDGFSFFPSAVATLTGTVDVFGYSKG